MSDATVTFLNHQFWHADADGTLLDNGKLNNGWIYSASFIASSDPNLAQATTPYAVGHFDREKEEVWEKVREDEFSHRPSRMKALFLFVSQEDVAYARQHWWGGASRVVFAVLVPQQIAKIHIADSRLLDSARQDWEADARRYWNGDLTEAPFLEAVVHGPVLIPNIEQYGPFGSSMRK